MKQVSVPKFALSEAAGETIRSTVWVALFLAIAGTSFDEKGEFRWESLLPGSDEATVAVAETQVPPAAATTPAITATAPVGDDAQTGAVPESASATESEGLAVASEPCQGNSWPFGYCADDVFGLAQLGFAGTFRKRPDATMNTAH